MDNSNMKFRDLEKVRQIFQEATGLDISYAYDDLVFPEHAAFLFQFDDEDDNNLLCYFHSECIEDEKKVIQAKLQEACEGKNCKLEMAGSFDMEQKGEEVEIVFG
jgi:hypothetical protein